MSVRAGCGPKLVAIVLATSSVLVTACSSEADRIGSDTSAPAASQPSSTQPSSTEPTTTAAGTPTSAAPASPSTTAAIVGGTDPGEAPPPFTGTPQGSETTVFEQGEIDSGLQAYVDRSVADLANRLGVDRTQVETVSAVLVVWPNAALGCPQPDRSYTQVPVDGSMIELRAGGRVYRYHAGGSQTPFLCEQALDKTPSTMPAIRLRRPTVGRGDSPTL